MYIVNKYLKNAIGFYKQILLSIPNLSKRLCNDSKTNDVTNGNCPHNEKAVFMYWKETVHSDPTKNK